MKIIVEGELFATYQKPEFKNKETGEITVGKHVVQLVMKNELKNGSIKNEMHDISIPDNELVKYKGKEGQKVQVPCNMFVKGELTLYGV